MTEHLICKRYYQYSGEKICIENITIEFKSYGAVISQSNKGNIVINSKGIKKLLDILKLREAENILKKQKRDNINKTKR